MLTTSYSEAAYFDGYRFQHIAAREEHLRLQRIRANNQAIARTLDRRCGIRR